MWNWFFSHCQETRDMRRWGRKSLLNLFIKCPVVFCSWIRNFIVVRVCFHWLASAWVHLVAVCFTFSFRWETARWIGESRICLMIFGSVRAHVVSIRIACKICRNLAMVVPHYVEVIIVLDRRGYNSFTRLAPRNTRVNFWESHSVPWVFKLCIACVAFSQRRHVARRVPESALLY
jgi:hypothetical protein